MMRFNLGDRRKPGAEATEDALSTYSASYQQNSVQVCLIRAPLLSLLSVDEGPVTLFQPFKSPLQGHLPGISAESQRKTLGCKIRSFGRPFAPGAAEIGAFKKDGEDPDAGLPPPNPLVLYTSPEDAEVQITIEVDPMLSRFLRDHQRQGVQFIFDCLMGLKEFEGQGCILADDMGLGKTLQSITVMWTLLKQGFNGRPAARKCVIVCPASLVNNWESEINKWLKGKCPCTAVADGAKEKVISKFTGFKYDRRSNVLISSYETFRGHMSRLEGVPIDLVICDEAHRLKNDKTLTAVAIQKLPAKMRLMLSGTPIQNDLNEFYALISLCNPNVLGDVSEFRRRYANPIILGREPDATKDQQNLAAERLAELSYITNQFVLRRTNTLLSKVLPPKINMNVFCNLTETQQTLYKEFANSATCRKIVNSDDPVMAKTLGAILNFMKLCNHPCLIKPGSAMKSAAADATLKRIHETCPWNANSRSSYPELSAKTLLLFRLLHNIRATTNDRIVIISNYTQTIDVFERLCKQCGYPCVRLDGTLSIKKRHKLVTTFNDPTSHSFAFLLSSKAGGCGINLIGANRLVLFDPDWNPANDKQALARVWRDGQRKTCYIYRFFSTGTIEEKIYQRQICKDGLSAMLVTDGANELKDALSGECLRNLFDYKDTTVSDTHDSISCERCTEGVGYVPQTPDFVEDDLLTWAHHTDLQTVPDPCLKRAIFDNNPPIDVPEGYKPVSFVMSCLVEFKDVPPPKKPEQPAPQVKIENKTEDKSDNADEADVKTENTTDKVNKVKEEAKAIEPTVAAETTPAKRGRRGRKPKAEAVTEVPQQPEAVAEAKEDATATTRMSTRSGRGRRKRNSVDATAQVAPESPKAKRKTAATAVAAKPERATRRSPRKAALEEANVDRTNTASTDVELGDVAAEGELTDGFITDNEEPVAAEDGDVTEAELTDMGDDSE
ncbi:DNA repair and recombination protein RAD54-like, putative [Babesia bigemina]|uniref:DNA repair and recombination protein RAD54-like, putative n=1 Tax=Babesia bigemina TaxID=5866 RepID=A0A061D9L0_BABBI|nr:DNA repair and recombination protein RAD54-like, putative [Babesia bigemina]CDR94410.1 DNA repair and recombination protein RAD54-like, putative [Babesia bigemina]|eukprot:XP_012766596.1 DNA repair and recombination protein RAD54-like, putative [Babesia bigemina]